MIEAHTLDAWTRLADRSSASYRWAIVVGGFGAPIFLFLAGVASVLAASARRRRGLSEEETTRRAFRRGWQILVFAFLFRLQSIVISGGGMRAFLKVDILNVMAVAMLVAALLWQFGKTQRGRFVLLMIATVLTAMLTPPIRSTAWLNWLPDALDAYLRPEVNRSTFTFFPWAGFLFGGVVAGIWLDSPLPISEGRRNQWLLAVGAIMTSLAYGAAFLPPIYAQTNYWTSSPTFFFVRLGIIIALVPLAYVWNGLADGQTKISPIRELGVASLFVYWIHVEMVYGVVSTPLHRALTFPQALVAMAVFAAFLFALVRLKQSVTSGRAGEVSTIFTRFRANISSQPPQSR